VYCYLSARLRTPVLKKKSQVTEAPSQIALFQMPDLPEPFRKAVPAVHIAPQAGPISLQQAKMFNALIKNAIEQNKTGERVWFEYLIQDLIRDVGLNSKNRDYVKATVNSLVGFVVNWDHLSGPKPEWNASGLIAGAKISGSLLKYQFSDNIRELLMNPRVYASIDMRIAREFKRSHSLTLWENVVRYEGVGRTPRLSVAAIRDIMLGLDWPGGSYAQYKTFKNRVLAPAIDEINHIADHEIELHEFKQGRSIAEVQFTIVSKRRPDVDDEAELDALSAVTKYGIPLSEARRLLSQHGAQAIRSAGEYTEERLKKKNAPALDNAGAYFRKALLGGWQADGNRNITGRTIASSATASTVLAEDRLLVQLAAFRADEARSYFKELDPADQSKYLDDYNASQSSAVLKFSASKKPSKSAETAFFHWLSEIVWGKPTDRDLLTFLLTENSINRT